MRYGYRMFIQQSSQLNLAMPKENDSRDYYNYPGSNPSGNRLPPIHEALGDVLDQPIDPRRSRGAPSAPQGQPSGPYHAHNNRTRESDGYSNYPASGPQHSYGGAHFPQTSQSQPSRERRDSRAREPNHAFEVYTTTPTGELILKRSSSQDDYKQRPLKAAQGDPTRRHICDECGERFDRPSALEMHQRSHTGEKPFVCSYPGCGKRFASGGNRTRHERIHDSPSAFQEREDKRGQGGPSSSSYYSSSDKSYYSSSRRT